MIHNAKTSTPNLITNLQAKQSDGELINQTRQDQGHWVEIMCERRKNWQFIKIIPQCTKQYLNLETCYEILEKGIDAVLFSYDSEHYDPITLTLNKKHTKLNCKLKKQTFMNKYFTFPTSIIFSSHTSILFGGISSTFQKLRPKMLNSMQLIRDSEKKSIERLLANKYPSKKQVKTKQGLYTLMDEEEINKQSFLMQASTFFSWQCVSIQHRVGITTDLVIRDRVHLMALLRVLEVHVMGVAPDDTRCLTKYTKIRFNNIVAYEAW